ncbi:MAG: MFS transporter [Brumimicrobium sp.]|nr:MFS transporter [Brumimicrobium sp.]MCO5268833.1 MFS transporter [Brumimicrobium sp.]
MKQIISTYKASFEGLSSESWMLSLVMLLNRMGGMVIPFLTVYLITVLHFSTDQAGIIMSCFGIGGLLGSVVGGWLTDKIGSFYMQFFSLLLTAPIFILLSSLTSISGVAVTVTILSFVNECFRPANSAAIVAYAKKGNLTRSFSLNRMAINLGFSFGPALGGFLATISYTWLFYGNSLTSLIAAFVFFWYFFKRKARNVSIFKQEELIGIENEGSPYKDKWYIVFSFFCFLYACVFFQLLIILPMFYEHLEFNQAIIGMILASNGIVVFITEMPIIHWTDKKFNVYINLIFGTIALFISFAWFLWDTSLISCFISMAMLSISEILVLPYMSTVAAKRSTEKNRGSYMGLQGLSIALAFVVMPFVATHIISYFSYTVLWLINLLILIFVILGFRIAQLKMPIQ